MSFLSTGIGSTIPWLTVGRGIACYFLIENGQGRNGLASSVVRSAGSGLLLAFGSENHKFLAPPAADRTSMFLMFHFLIALHSDIKNLIADQMTINRYIV